MYGQTNNILSIIKLIRWTYQKNNYELGEGIAAHGWFTSSFLLANFLLDPENNFFGAGIKFKY